VVAKEEAKSVLADQKIKPRRSRTCKGVKPKSRAIPSLDGVEEVKSVNHHPTLGIAQKQVALVDSGLFVCHIKQQT
jgi:hypothetical protein